MARFHVFGFLLLGALPAAAHAQGTGVPSCDAFLDAYQKCAGSPGVPEAARPAMLLGIGQMRTSFREAAANPVAARALAKSCADTHASVRQSMVSSFKCDFPQADVVADTAPPPAETPRPRPAGSAEQQEIAKANAWVDAQNYIVSWHHLNQDLRQYQETYARNVPKAGAKPAPDATFYFNISDFDGLLERLRKAQELPGTIPGVDEAGARLLTALDGLNPVVKRLTRYRSTREYQEDGFKLAREQNDAVVSGMKAASKAADLFGAALGERELVRDEKRLTTLPEGSLARMLMRASLDARRVVAQQDLLEPRADVKPMADAVAALAASNEALHARLDATSPKPSSYCTGYAEYVDSMVGNGRGVVRDMRGNGSPAGNARDVIRDYNRSIDALKDCRKELDKTG